MLGRRVTLGVRLPCALGAISMSDKDPKSIDVLGVKPIGEAINTLVKGTVDGAAAFFSRICLPAAEEFGLLLRDKVSNWRAKNLVKIAERAEKKLLSNPDGSTEYAHPRIASLIVEQGSWADDDDVQQMWSGLLASSCTKKGDDESNLMFINLLSQITSSEARMLNYGCEKVKKSNTKSNWISIEGQVIVSVEELKKIAVLDDVQRLDRELDHLRVLGLIEGGLRKPTPVESFIETTVIRRSPSIIANLSPTYLGLQMYVRCQGSKLSPAEYFGLAKRG